MYNYYKELSLNQSAGEEEIKKALNRELRMWTNRTNAPDLKQRQEAECMVSILEEAEQILLDSVKRREYDEKLRTAPLESERKVEQVIDEKSDVLTLIDKAWEFLADGNIPDALYIATKATERDGSNPWAWAVLAQAKFRWGQIEDAVYEYRRALNLEPRQAGLYFDLGSVYESVERWQEALENYDRASKIEPDVVMYRAAVGSALVRLEKYREAIPILEECVGREKDNKSYAWFLALAYNDMVISEWYEGPNGAMYCVNQESAEKGIRYFGKALRLNFADNELRQLIRRNLKVANWASKKHWSRPIRNTIKGVLGVFFGGLILAAFIEQAAGSALGMMVWAGTIGTWVWTGFKKGCDINRNTIGVY